MASRESIGEVSCPAANDNMVSFPFELRAAGPHFSAMQAQSPMGDPHTETDMVIGDSVLGWTVIGHHVFAAIEDMYCDWHGTIALLANDPCWMW